MLNVLGYSQEPHIVAGLYYLYARYLCGIPLHPLQKDLYTLAGNSGAASFIKTVPGRLQGQSHYLYA